MRIFLETERLILRQFTEDDADNLFALDSEPEVLRWGNGGNCSSYEVIKTQTLPKWINYYTKYEHYGIWAVVEKFSNQFIGWFHFYPAIENKFAVELNLVTDAEIALGYRFHQASWGKGYATEGSRNLVSKGFAEWGVKRVVAWTLLENKASIRVMEKSGLKFEKEFIFTETQLPNLKQSERQAVKYVLNKDEFDLEDCKILNSTNNS
jgi:[ribosomal protein S5]-alanine N-acetyltransferase